MKTSANDPDLTIIALLFMLLLVYTSLYSTPETSMDANNSESVAKNSSVENESTTVKILE